MKRRALILVPAVGLVAAAVAMAGIPDTQYEGRIEGDPTTQVGFNVKKVGGVKRVKKISGVAPGRCYSGSSGVAPFLASGSLRVDDEGRFRGKRSAVWGKSAVTTLKFKGVLLRGGKARGTLSIRTPRGEPGETCYTGTLAWKARKGAEVVPVEAP